MKCIMCEKRLSLSEQKEQKQTDQKLCKTCIIAIGTCQSGCQCMCRDVFQVYTGRGDGYQ